MKNSANGHAAPEASAEFDWKRAFEIASAQRDDATRNLQNMQIEFSLLQTRYADIEARRSKLSESPAEHARE